MGVLKELHRTELHPHHHTHGATHLRRSPRSPTTVSYFSGKRLAMTSWMHAACAASTTCTRLA